VANVEMDALLNRPPEVSVLSLIALWLAARAGRYVETRWSPLTGDEKEQFKTVVAATLTLLGLLIGFSFSMAVSRYDQRKDYEEAEANAIGTAYLRAGLLPPADADGVRGLLKQYTDLRIQFYKERRDDNVARIDDDTLQLQNKLWSVVEPVAALQPTPVVALAVAGMNDVLNTRGSTQAAWLNRIPTTAWQLMAAIAIACCALIGYSGHQTRASTLLILPVVLSTAFFLIAEIDSPRHGLIRVLPQNLISLAHDMASSGTQVGRDGQEGRKRSLPSSRALR
jgi:protein-S-isoprenylcysteine O-methyltransferase Ste14